MRTRLYDVVALLARFGVGVVFIAHGWQKIQVGITATGRNFDAMGVPAATPAAVYSTFVELLGGAALIIGLGLPAAGLLLFVDMAGAAVFVHAEHGIFMVDGGHVQNGVELVLALGTATMIFGLGGAGRLTLDSRLFGRTRRTLPSDATLTARPVEKTDQPAPAAIGSESSKARPRLATEMTGDTSRDVIVAGPPAGGAEKTPGDKEPRPSPPSGKRGKRRT